MAKVKFVTARTPKLSVVMSAGSLEGVLAADEPCLFLGEIPNMPGHCAVVSRAGHILWGLHLDLLRVATEDEI